ACRPATSPRDLCRIRLLQACARRRPWAEEEECWRCAAFAAAPPSVVSAAEAAAVEATAPRVFAVAPGPLRLRKDQEARDTRSQLTDSSRTPHKVQIVT